MKKVEIAILPNEKIIVEYENKILLNVHHIRKNGIAVSSIPSCAASPKSLQQFLLLNDRALQ